MLSNRIQAIGDGKLGNITMKQYVQLICLSVFDEPPSWKKTADVMGCSYQNGKRMASVLQEQGYWHLSQDILDHRRQKLILTGKVSVWNQDKEKK